MPACRYVSDRLKATAGPTREQIAGWIRQLDAPQFAVRERATAALTKVVDEAEGDLRRALSRASPEARERIHRILDGIHDVNRSADRLAPDSRASRCSRGKARRRLARCSTSSAAASLRRCWREKRARRCTGSNGGRAD